MKKIVLMLVVSVFLLLPNQASASLFNLGGEELLQAGGTDIVVPGYSVPSYVDWNSDGRGDLIVGQGGDGYPGLVRVYLNNGTASSPQFTDYFYAQSNGSDLTVPGSGCLGAFARTVNWNGDSRKDLLVGQADGTIKIFLNTGTAESPSFDGGTTLKVGPTGSKTDIDVGSRATCSFVDWNNDGEGDLVVGAIDGKIHLFINAVTDTEPDFIAETLAQEDGSDLVVSSLRSSPVIAEMDGDGKKDLLTGNTDGQLLFYSNVGADSAPSFSGYVLLESEGISIDLPGTPRSRPFVCDWTGDGYLDVLVGAGDGKVHLFQSVPEPATVLLLGLGFLALLNRRGGKSQFDRLANRS